MGADTLHVLALEWVRLTEDPGTSASEREVAAARAEKLMGS